MKRFPIYLFIIAVLASALSGVAKSKSKKDIEADARKADYFYLEALRTKSLGNNDATFELLTRASELNPTDNEIQAELATYIISLANGDRTEVRRAIDMLAGYYQENPGDLYNSLAYAYLLEKVGSINRARLVLRDLHYRNPDKIDLTFRYADFLTSFGDSTGRAEAYNLFDSIETINGIDFAVVTKKMQLHRLNNDTTAIINEAKRLYKTNPTLPDHNIFLGQIYSLFQQNDSALSYLRRAIDLDPSNGLSYYSLANYYLSQGDTTSYNREIYQALAHDNLDFENKASILQSYVQEAYNPEQLDTLLQTMVELHPHEAKLHEFYAMSLIQETKYDRAADQMQLSLDLEPDNEKGWNMLTSLYFQISDYDKAHAALDKAIRFFPENAVFPLQLAAIYVDNKDFEQANKYLDKAENLAADKPELISDIYSNRANISILSGDTLSAFTIYEKALLLNPENTGVMNNYAYHLALANKDLPHALEMIEKAIAEEPENATWLDTYAWVLFKMKRYEEALSIIDQAIEKDNNNLSSEILEHAGDIYFMNARPDEAVEFWKKALELDQDNALLKKKVKQRTFFFK